MVEGEWDSIATNMHNMNKIKHKTYKHNIKILNINVISTTIQQHICYPLSALSLIPCSFQESIVQVVFLVSSFRATCIQHETFTMGGGIYKSTLFFQLHHFGYRRVCTDTFVHGQITPFLFRFLFPQADVSGTVFARFVSWFFLSKLLIVCFHFFFNGLGALLLPWSVVVAFPSPTPRFGGRGRRGPRCLF